MIARKGMRIYLGDKELGEIRPLVLQDKVVFIRHRNPEHYFIEVQGFGYNKELLDYLEKMGIDEIRELYHGNEEIIFVARIETIRKFGIEKNYDEPQIGLATKHMTHIGGDME